MPFITVKIAAGGTALQDGNESLKGHIWLDTDGGNGDPRTYSFGPVVEGTPIGKGYVSSQIHWSIL